MPSDNTFKPITFPGSSEFTPNKLPDPLGYTKNFVNAESSARNDKRQREILLKQASQVARSPMSNIVMQVFMMWMMGSNLHIFSIFMIYQMMSGPIKSMMNVQTAFSRFSSLGSEILFHKLTYIGINIALLCLGLWKLNGIGLLPTKPSDYVSLVPKSLVNF